jgi:hypothetical protein
MTGCSICGGPVDAPETHHDDHSKDGHDPDNLRPVHRRCHMHHHENDKATDHRSRERFGPTRPNVSERR